MERDLLLLLLGHIRLVFVDDILDLVTQLLVHLVHDLSDVLGVIRWLELIHQLRLVATPTLVGKSSS